MLERAYLAKSDGKPGAVNCAMCAPWRSWNFDAASLCNHGRYVIFQLRQLLL